MALKHIKEHFLYQADSLGQWPIIAKSGGSSDGPFQVIQHGQQIEYDRAILVAAFRLTLPRGPLLVVLKVRPRPSE